MRIRILLRGVIYRPAFNCGFRFAQSARVQQVTPRLNNGFSRNLLASFGFVLIKQVRLEEEKQIPYISIDGVVKYGDNVRSVDTLPNSIWHKDNPENEAFLLYCPFGGETSGMPMTGIGREKSVVEALPESLEFLSYRLQEHYYVTMRKRAISRSSIFELKDILDDNSMEKLIFYHGPLNTKDARNLAEFFYNFSQLLKWAKYIDNSEKVNRLHDSYISYFNSLIFYQQNITPIKDFYRYLDESLGHKVYRHKWMPGDIILIDNDSDIFHTRIPIKEEEIMQPLYRFNIKKRTLT